MSAEIAAGAAPEDIVTPTRLLAGQMLVVAAIVVAGLWAATQWAAAMLAYQPELGAAWFNVGGQPVYRPWQILSWWFAFGAYAPGVFDKAGSLAASSGLLGCAAAAAQSPPNAAAASMESGITSSQCVWSSASATITAPSPAI